jgi:uncharacterized YigZ family protein
LETRYCIFEKQEDEYDEKRSRFIAEMYPIASEEEAKELITATKKKYYDARHHCYAYIIGYDSNIKKSSDDGEPSGTAGKPILEILESREVFNALIIVTRYFGGIKLGTGGLTRAYREAARMVCDGNTLSPVRRGCRMEITLDYSMGGTLSNYYRREGIFIEDTIYGEKQTIKALVPEELVGKLKKDLQNMLGTEDLPEISEPVSFCESAGNIVFLEEK